jgi:hypothetical protein
MWAGLGIGHLAGNARQVQVDDVRSGARSDGKQSIIATQLRVWNGATFAMMTTAIESGIVRWTARRSG